MPRQDKLPPEELRAEIEELFSDLWQMPRFAGLRRGFRPNVDSFTTDEPSELTVVIELPGVDPKSLNVVVGERVLVVAGERPRRSGRGRVYQQMEIEYGPFQRQIRLADDVDPEHAAARYEHGVPTITLPIGRPLPASQRHAIQVQQV
jgi:HSP20 family protein